METTGAKLKKIRLEKGLTLEEAHKKTKIHLNILKAIEEGRLLNLNPIYTKGFLKIYCQFLGVDPREYIDNYKEPQAMVRTVPLKQEDAGRSLLKAASLKIGTLRPRIKLKTIFILVLALILIFGLFRVGKAIIFGRRGLRQKARAAGPQTKLAKVPLPAAAEQPSNKNLISGVRLTIRAKEDCWVRLKSDGKIIFQSVLKKGRAETWQAKDKIEFSLGNAAGVVLEVNGKIFANLGRKGQVLKNVIITKDGLAILR